MKKPWRLGALAVTLFGIIACASGTTEPRATEVPHRILFIGNSLTYYNDLPGMVKALADSAGAQALTVESVAYGGYGLEDHWNQGDALQKLKSARWDLVILQQGPSGAPESRLVLIEYAKKFADPIRESGARPAVYMVWPESFRTTAYDSVASNYTAAADSVDAMLFPGIREWQAIWARRASTELYSEDGLHPMPLGTYAIAVMMVHQITGKRAVGLPRAVTTADGTSFITDPATARLVQEAAEEAARRYGRE